MESAPTNHTRRGAFYRCPHSAAQDMGIEKANYGNKTKTTLTQGSVARGMLLFALPIFISNLFQQLYNAADSLIVGNFLGGEALAAVGSSGSLSFSADRVSSTVDRLGAGVVVARYFGAKDWDRMRRTIHTTVRWAW